MGGVLVLIELIFLDGLARIHAGGSWGQGGKPVNKLGPMYSQFSLRLTFKISRVPIKKTSELLFSPVRSTGILLVY